MAAILAVAAAALAGTGAAEAANFSVNPTQIYLTRTTASALLTLRNDSQETLRFQLTAFAWSQSRSGEMTLEPTGEVVFFPALLTLKPGEERRVRVGTAQQAQATERTYRLFVEELPPLETTAGGAAVRVLTRMGIPIFVQPPDGAPRITLDGLAVHEGRLQFTVANGGSVHAVPSSIVARASDAGGAVLFERSVAGWYVLAGGRRDFEVELPADACGRASSYAVHVTFEESTISSTVAAPPGGCSAP
jgi:fimbrial chaperone protein